MGQIFWILEFRALFSYLGYAMGEEKVIARQILSEIGTVLDQVEPEEVESLVGELLAAQKVFFFAVGRVLLSLECMAKRLGHLGIDCQVVGSINEKPINPRDLLLIASGSGESKLPVEIARIARNKGARLGLITSARSSTIKSMSDFVVHLPCPTKNDPAAGVSSRQPMSALFDQSLHIFGDVVALLVLDRKGLKVEELWKYHANLE
jgi:6-phospho-3-hexuloisomerase